MKEGGDLGEVVLVPEALLQEGARRDLAVGAIRTRACPTADVH